MRTVIVTGLHLNIPEALLPNRSAREHRQRLFWTAYMFDRMSAAQLGHPVAIRDEEIEVDLPCPLLTDSSSVGDDSDYQYHVASIQLARLLTGIVRSIYSIRTQPQGTQLSARVHQALQDLLAWVDQLPPRLQVDNTPGAANDCKFAALHLSFNQVCLPLFFLIARSFLLSL
jgi:proline utilization trans-activator